LNFHNVDISWAQFIINNRNDFDYVNVINDDFHYLYYTYDIIYGAIADNEIVSIANKLKLLQEKITLEEVNSIRCNYKTTQISFHTNRSLSCIRLIDCDIIKIQKGSE
jgi:hypothetical protein